MKNFAFLFLLASFFVVSCGSTVPAFFGRKTPHEKYAEMLRHSGASQTEDGMAWLSASQTSLVAAQEIPVPYRVKGIFPAGKPRALGFRFKAAQGEEIVFHLQKNEDDPLYTDLFWQDGITGTHILSGDEEDSVFRFTVKETGIYVLRIQPEIEASVTYELDITSGPSLGFPVSGTRARVGSVWGDSRDGGRRSHEGIDIFAPKRTPVVAAADGYISSVRNGGLGGKTVNLRPVGTHYSLYYAHLDEQLVEAGQFVRKGDVIGLVGNTGNAKTTPPHLHFGIYAGGGAVDPLPFVNDRKNKPGLPVPGKKLEGPLRLARNHKSHTGMVLKANTELVPLAMTPTGYIAEAPGGDVVLLPFSIVKKG
jgi:murein DD-endopeptidase MepM/ murein hydrolase activator NlpD